MLDEFYEQTSENQPAQLVIVHYLVSEELVTASQLWSLSYIEFDGTDYFMFENDSEDGTWKDDYREMYFHSLNIIRKQPEQSEIELIMIVFTDQEDVSDEKAEQYVQLLYDGKRPENVEVRPFLNLRKKVKLYNGKLWQQCLFFYLLEKNDIVMTCEGDYE